MNFEKTLRFIKEKTFKIFIFLLPTQLAYHFWPKWSHIYGVRVDYLAPTIYLTDLLIIVLLIVNAFEKIIFPNIKTVRNNRKKSNPFRKEVLLLFSLLIFSVINISTSEFLEVSVLKWVKFFELLFLSIYIINEKELNFKDWVGRPLSYSLIFFSIIAVLQFFLKRTLGGFFYFLGERSFNISTPGIALVDIFSQEYLRAYSTFSHPNSLAGYYLVGLIIIFNSSTRSFANTKKLSLENKHKNNLLSIMVLIFSSCVLILTFSLGVWVAGLFVLTFFLISKNKAIFKKISLAFFLGIVSISLLSPILFQRYFINRNLFKENVSNRIELAKTAEKIYSQKPFFGIGLNNFIIYLPKTSADTEVVWKFQPIHNIFLSILTETGLVGLLIFLYLLFLAFEKTLKSNNIVLVLSLIAIIITGAFDHYWMTLQQNQLLFSVVLGLSFRKK